MFTGLIEEAGRVRWLAPHGAGWRLRVAAGGMLASVALGDSIAVNGCCLTAVKITSRGKAKLIQFDLLQESWKRNNYFPFY